MDTSIHITSGIERLVAVCRTNRPAFAGVDEAAAAFFHAALRSAEDPLSALERLHADDLYLAAACSLGNSVALAEFEVRVLPAALTPVRSTSAPDFTDEVAQIVRSQLFTAPLGKVARIASYGGRAPLENWTRAVALRVAYRLRARDRDERTALQERLLEIAIGESAELDLIRGQLQEQFRAAFGAALAGLPRRERGILRLHVVSGVTLDGLAVAYGVHRATVARWLAAARSAVLKGTRARLGVLLRLDASEIDSLIEQAQSRLEVSIKRFLAESVPPPGGR